MIRQRSRCRWDRANVDRLMFNLPWIQGQLDFTKSTKLSPAEAYLPK